MKSIFVFAFFVISVISGSGQVIRIDFREGSTGDLDLLIQEGLELIDFEAFINYHNRRANEPYDYVLKYDETKTTVRFNLYTAANVRTSRSESFVYNNNFHLAVSNALSEMFNQRVNLQRERSGGLPGLPSPRVNVVAEKLDSAIYFFRITARYSDYEDRLKESFLKIAEEYTPNFEAYFREIKEQQNYQYGVYFTSSIWHQLQGIVTGIETAGQVFLDEPPSTFINYLEKQNPTPGVDISFRSEASDSTATLFVARDTGFIGSAGKYSIFINGKLACRISNQRYVMQTLKPGTHAIAIQARGATLRRGSREQTIEVKQGDVLFFKILQDSSSRPSVILFQTDELEARLIFPTLRVNENCN